jgi:ApaG protein
MTIKITTGIKVSVRSKYMQSLNNALFQQHMFEYEISIENYNDFPVQLISRHWYIFDSIAGNSEIIGEGVVGLKPILFQDADYQYKSACNLKSDYGTMSGYYIFENIRTAEKFKVEIPKFELALASKLN